MGPLLQCGHKEPRNSGELCSNARSTPVNPDAATPSRDGALHFAEKSQYSVSTVAPERCLTHNTGKPELSHENRAKPSPQAPKWQLPCQTVPSESQWHTSKCYASHMGATCHAAGHGNTVRSTDWRDGNVSSTCHSTGGKDVQYQCLPSHNVANRCRTADGGGRPQYHCDSAK